MVSFGIAHTIIHVRNIKPKVMKLDRCTKELKPQTKISWGKNTNYIHLGNYPCNAKMFHGVL